MARYPAAFIPLAPRLENTAFRVGYRVAIPWETLKTEYLSLAQDGGQEAGVPKQRPAQTDPIQHGSFSDRRSVRRRPKISPLSSPDAGRSLFVLQFHRKLERAWPTDLRSIRSRRHIAGHTAYPSAGSLDVNLNSSPFPIPILIATANVLVVHRLGQIIAAGTQTVWLPSVAEPRPRDGAQVQVHPTSLQYVGSCIYFPTFSKHLMSNDRIADVVRLVKKAGILRPRDLQKHGIPRLYLRMAADKGEIKHVGRGLYVARGTRSTEHHSLAQASKRIPHGIVCLLSALRFHDLTTQSPFQVWLAISEKARLPKIDNPPLRIVRFSHKTLAYGVQEHHIEGVLVRIFSPAKTVADCFRYRNKIGLDVALEALRECRRKRRASSDEIWRAAKVCRLAKVMRPYLESLSRPERNPEILRPRSANDCLISLKKDARTLAWF